MILVRASLLLVALLLAAGSVAAPQARARDEATAITVITPGQAQAASLQGRPFAMAFGDGENGTDLMLRFLRAARAQGASFMSDIEIHLVTRSQQRGWQHCVTHVTPGGAPPARYRAGRVAERVARTVTEYEVHCRMVMRPRTRTETHYESQYDVTSNSHQTRPVTRTYTEMASEQECQSEPVTRTVMRYEHQLESRYVPPQWRTELRWMSEWALDETPPLCTSLSTDVRGGARPHFIRAMIYAQRE
jgi:hypothetical protein